MQSVQEIEKAVTKLSASELLNFREWFAKYDYEIWDRQLEEDAKSGKLDKLADQAISDFEAGKCREI